jgi:tRNA1(Val) A37 N6-methylase TrmN6
MTPAPTSESETPEGPQNTTEDRLLGGRVRLLQPAKGYRAGMDAALLAAALDLRPGERGLEAGCGAGGALLQAAIRCPHAALRGVERDPAAVALAHQNILLNGLQGQVEVSEGDIAAKTAPAEPLFDAAFSNPPFFDDPGALRAPHPSRRAAWMADDGLKAWVSFLLRNARDGGRVTVIHRADRLADLLALLALRAGSFQVRPIQPFADAPAKRVLVRAVRNGRGPLRLLPAFVLHDRSGRPHTSEAEAVLKGEAALEWLR